MRRIARSIILSRSILYRTYTFRSCSTLVKPRTFQWKSLNYLSLRAFGGKKKSMKDKLNQKREAEKQKIREEFAEVQNVDEMVEQLRKQNKSVAQTFEQQLNEIRSGRASQKMFDDLQVNAYGEKYPFQDLCQVLVRGNNLLLINVYDESIRENVMKAVNNSGFDLACTLEGNNIQVKLHSTTTENKKDFMTKAKRVETHAKDKLKNIRQKTLAKAKKLEKLIGIDESRVLSERCEKVIKEGIKQIERILAKKEKEIMSA